MPATPRTGDELAKRELELFAETCEHHDLARTEKAWREIHLEYSRALDLGEAVKRALFIQWYREADSSFVTGIGELDDDATDAVLSEVRRRLAETDPNLLEVELEHMVAWYMHQHDPGFWELPKPSAPDDHPPCEYIEATAGRGLMGHYWATLCGEWDRIPIRGTAEAQASAFADALRVLDGDTVAPRGDGAAHKGLALVLPLTNASRVDATPEEVAAVHEGDRRRTMMFVESLPAALGDLMRRAGLTRIQDSVVCRLPAGRFFDGAKPDRTMWLLREAAKLTMYFADATDVAPPDAPISPIDSARWPVPEIRPAIPWTPAPHVFKDIEGCCPHCGAVSARWRIISDTFFVCAACGRSFEEQRLEAKG